MSAGAVDVAAIAAFLLECEKHALGVLSTLRRRLAQPVGSDEGTKGS